MRIWQVQCHRIRESAQQGQLEESKWMKMYLKRMDNDKKSITGNKGKNSKKSKKKVKKNQLAAMTKEVKNVKVKMDTKE